MRRGEVRTKPPSLLHRPSPALLQAEPSGVMGVPVPVLWALLVSLGCAEEATEPGKGSPLGCGGLRELRGAAGASLGSGSPLRRRAGAQRAPPRPAAAPQVRT